MKAARFVAPAVLPVLLASAACAPYRAVPPRPADAAPVGDTSPLPPDVRADLADVRARLAVLRDSVHAAAARLAPHLPEARILADSAAADIEFMLGRRGGWGRDMPAEYLRGLDEVIQGLASADPAVDPAAAVSVFRDAVEEIRIRADQCRATPRGLGGLIAVEARVLRGGQPVRGEWEIHYRRKILQHVPGAAAFRFNRLAPGSERLSPGVYRVWARHPATRRLTEQHDLKVRRADEPVVWEISVP